MNRKIVCKARSTYSLTIAIVNFGMGNIHSIQKAIALYHEDVDYTYDLATIASAKAIVLPGDGAFIAAIQGLGTELRAVILRKIQEKTPLLAICIGFQILFENSTEFSTNGTCAGLSLIPGVIRRFSNNDNNLRIPHIGWNLLEPTKKENIWCTAQDYAYFSHSYRAVGVPPEYVVANTEYGQEHFPAIVEKENILATQFHPEKSADFGLQLLQRWVEKVKNA